MNKVAEKNLAFLQDSVLKKEFENYVYDVEPKLAMTNGYNLSYKDVLLHNEESPIMESSGIFVNTKNEPNVVHIVYGLGLGYLFQIVAKESKGQVILYEPNMDILYTAFSYVDFSNELAKSNVRVFTDLEKLRIYLSAISTRETEVQVLSLPSYRKLLGTRFSQDVEIIQLAYGSTVLDNVFKKRKMKVVTYNMLKNIPQLLNERPINEYENLYNEEVAIIVSAGPTLSRDIEILKKYQKNAIIFSVGTALKTLVANDIKVDYLCIVESFNTLKQVEGVDLSNIDLILEPFTHPCIHGLNTKGKILHCSDNMPASKYFANKVNVSTDGYFTQGTVSFMALNSAVKMGFKKIILVGQDLAFIDGQCYSKQSAYEDLICKKNEETGKYEIFAKDFDRYANALLVDIDKDLKAKTAKGRLNTLNKSLYFVRGVEGGQVPTEAGYAAFINHFVSYAKELNGIELINSSLKGAQIDGFKNVSLEVALQNSFPVEKKEPNVVYEFDIKALLKALMLSQETSKKHSDLIDSSGKIISKLLLEIKRNPAVDKDKLLKVRELIENFTILNEPRDGNELFGWLTMAEEIELSDFLKTVKNYDSENLKEVVIELKHYYDSVKELTKLYPIFVERIMGEIK